MRKKSRDLSSGSEFDTKDIFSSTKTDKKSRKKPKKQRSPFKRVMIALGKAIVALFLVGVITGSIVVTALTVYVMKATETDSDISLEKDAVMTSGITTIYGQQNGEWIALAKMSGGTKRIWCDITDVPPHVKNAFVAIEDKRFYEHEGVDFKRTFLAFANMILHFWDSNQGGSTITQQLVKNLTNDDKQTPTRKVREIFRAMSLERTYSKDQILQAYLNVIQLGGGNGDYLGLATGARLYFNKDVSELTLAEGASLAAITKSPKRYNPIENPENNLQRRNLVLDNMLDQGMITEQEHAEAISTPVEVNRGKVTGTLDDKDYQSYFVDNVINEVIAGLSEKYGWDSAYAETKLKSGGYEIYTTIDVDLQNKLEEQFQDLSNFRANEQDDDLLAAMVIYDHEGEMKAVVGNRGEKPPGDRVVRNNATQAERQPGSAIKPLASYAMAIDQNMYDYSNIVSDEETSYKIAGQPDWTPKNYTRKYYGNVTIKYALQHSLNTIPAKIVNQLGPQTSYDFLTQKLGITTLDPAGDPNMSPMSVGALTKGVHLNELTNAYQIFTNGGHFVKSHSYTKVLNASGDEVLAPDTTSTQVISEESSSIMNRLLRQVVMNGGTGAKANLDSLGIELIAKTGTTDDNKDFMFIGATPYYISGLWVGYDNPKNMRDNTVIPKKYQPYDSGVIWKNIMGDLYQGMEPKEFELTGEVVKKQFCTVTGLLAGDGCPTDTGYYKASKLPDTCNGGHGGTEPEEGSGE